MKTILVLCTGNSTRSQMAQGYLQHFAGTKAEVLSAGVEAHGLNPRAVAVMAEDGIDISHHASTLMEAYADRKIDFVITVCDNAYERCPRWLRTGENSAPRLIHQAFEDPSKTIGPPDLVLAGYRRIRDEIKAFSAAFINDKIL